MKKIHMEETAEKRFKRGKAYLVPMHYFYLCDNAGRSFLCKQRRYLGVERYFRQDLRLDALRRHKWGRDKMVDNLMTKLPKYLADAQRHSDDYAA